MTRQFKERPIYVLCYRERAILTSKAETKNSGFVFRGSVTDVADGKLNSFVKQTGKRRLNPLSQQKSVNFLVLNGTRSEDASQTVSMKIGYFFSF